MIFQDIKFFLTTILVGVVLISCASSNLYTGFEYSSVQSQITNVAYDNKLKQYTVTVSYTANGINYTNSLMEETPFDKKNGDNITINYLKNNPNKIMLYTDKTKTIIYSSLCGVVLLFLSYLTFTQIERESEKLEKLF